MVYERQLDELRAKVQSPSPGTCLRALRYYAGLELQRSSRWCLVSAAAALVVVVGGIAGGLSDVADFGRCSALASEPHTQSVSFTFQVESGAANIEKFGARYADIDLHNFYPFGGIELQIDHAPVPFPGVTNGTVTLELIAYALRDSDLPSKAALAAMVNLTDLQPLNDDDGGGYEGVVVRADPPPDARKRCLSLRMRLSGEVKGSFVVVDSQSAMVNVSGNFLDLTSNAAAPRSFATLRISTTTAPVVLQNGYVDPLAIDPVAGFPPSTVITSDSGDVFITDSTSSGLSVTTGGTIYTSTVGSFSTNSCKGVCGDVNLTATGTGGIVGVKAFGGYNAYLRTEHGPIILANMGVIIGKTMVIESVDGPITMANFLQAFNNETFVTSGGKISVSVAFSNRMYITGKGEADVSIIELFAGSPAPGKDLFNPPILGNYSAPLARIQVDRGDINILGIGGSPTGTVFSNMMSLLLYANVGKVKVEVNGGGLNGPYRVISEKGKAVVEVDGRPGALSGTIGTGSLGENEIYVYSRTGNVQLSVLPSPL
jgi:hypothetical protein